MDIPVSPGDILLGKYYVERVLGKGGMGAVVAVRHVELGELFAIKLLLPAMLTQPDALERFLREARAAARLRTEHVARVHDVGRLESGAPYMLMEHLDGSDLKAILRREGPLPVDQVVAYVLDVCEAIAEAHSVGIIHRDLKPANLFLVQQPSGKPRVKVLDFGISKHVGADIIDITATGAMLGSPVYMSPEQMTRTKAVDVRTDIWALGVTMFELLTGQVPFKGQMFTEIIAGVLQDEPSRPGEMRPGVPRALDSIILRCLRKRPDERFQTVVELVNALRAVPPASVVANDGSTIPNHQAHSGTSLTPLSLGIGPVDSAGSTFPPAAPSASNGTARVVVVAGVLLGFIAGGGAFLAIKRDTPVVATSLSSISWVVPRLLTSVDVTPAALSQSSIPNYGVINTLANDAGAGLAPTAERPRKSSAVSTTASPSESSPSPIATSPTTNEGKPAQHEPMY